MQAILKDIEWLEQQVKHLAAMLLTNSSGSSYEEVAAPDLRDDTSTYATFINEGNFSREERLLIVLALANHVNPGMLDRNLKQRMGSAFGKYPELGGVEGENFKGLIPTGLTWLALATGNDLLRRIDLLKKATSMSVIVNEIVGIKDSSISEPFLSGAIELNIDLLRLFINQ